MSLVGRVCLVTGASRGIGKGCARALAAQGAKVYITGRSLTPLQQTAEELGKLVVPVVCDHSADTAIEDLFKQIKEDNDGRLDFLVNNCFSAGPALLGKDADKNVNKFWEQDPLVWDEVNRVGLRANYIASVYAARLMVPRGDGIIVNMSSAGGLAYIFNSAYGVGKAAQDRMALDFNVELEGTGVKALAVWPGAVRTEFVMEDIIENKSEDPDVAFKKSMFVASQTPDWVGRTVAGLLTDPKVHKKAGRVNWVYDLANDYKVVENDGSKAPSHRCVKSILQMLSLELPIIAKLGLPSIAPTWIVIPKPFYTIALWAKGNKF